MKRRLERRHRYGCKLTQNRTDSLKMHMAFGGDVYTLPGNKKKNHNKKKTQTDMLRAQRDTQCMLLNGKKKKGCSSHATSVPKKNNKWEEGNSCVYFVENFFRTVGEKRAPVSCGKGFVWWRRRIFNLGRRLSSRRSSPVSRCKGVFNCATSAAVVTSRVDACTARRLPH